MDQQEWKKVNNIVDTALELDGEERTTFIKEQCAGNKELRYKVTELLKSIEQSDTEDFLEATEAFPAYLAADLSDNDDQEHASSLVGETIDQYHIKRVIGHGGMGSVFLANRADDAYQGEVALKIMRQGMDTPSNIARFERERNILAKLDHPNIARLLDGGVTDAGLPYLVMEYVDGISLFEYCDKKNLPVEQRLDLFKEVCRAVRHAHQNAVIHRDLKPSNILITDDGNVKVLDFGIAKLVETKDSKTTQFQTRTGARMLTYGYAAPEQIEDQPVTTSTDAYSLGILLYELLCGVHPFDLEDKNLTNIEQLIREQTPYTLSRRFNNLPKDQQKRLARRRNTTVSSLLNSLAGDLEAIVMKALRKESESRYRSAGNMLEDLERREQNLPVIARKDTVRYKVGKFVRRHKNGIAVTAGVLLLIVALTAFYTWQIAEERNKAQLEAGKAQETSEFLVNLFSASNPTETHGETVPVKSILEEGLNQIDQLGEQPEVQSQMVHTMGKVYTNLGEYNKAEMLLKRALNIQTNVDGKFNTEVASIYNDLGGLHLKAQEVQQAEPFYAKALDIRKEVLGPNDIRYAETLSDLGALMRFKGNLDSARVLHNRALKIRQNNLTPNHPDIANSLNNLGVLENSKGNLGTARQYYQKALEIRRNHFGDVHPKVANVKNNLAVLYRTMGKFDLAETYYTETLEIRKEIYGLNHPATAQSFNNFAGFLLDRKQYDKAEKNYRQALKIRENILGKTHIQTGTSYNNLANVLFEKKQLESSEQAYRRATDIYKSELGEKHRYVGIVKSNLGKVLTTQNNFDRAATIFDEALSILQNSYSSENLSFANLYSDKATLAIKKENLNKAMQLLEDALEIRDELQGTAHPEFQQDVKQLSNIYKQLGFNTRADSLTKAFSLK